MLNCLAVGTGGFIGSVLRYLVGLMPIGENMSFPYKTLLINIAGSFLIAVFSVFALKNRIDPKLSLMLRTGLCGGFTTFSTFAYESFGLMKNGNVLNALIYITLSILLGIAAIFLAEFLFLN